MQINAGLVTLSSRKWIQNELILMTILFNINIADINGEMNMDADDVATLLLQVFLPTTVFEFMVCPSRADNIAPITCRHLASVIFNRVRCLSSTPPPSYPQCGSHTHLIGSVFYYLSEY